MLQLKREDLPHHSPTTGTAEFCPLDLEDDYMGKWRRLNAIKYEKKYAFPVPDGLWNHHSLSLFPQHSSTQTKRNTLPKESDASSGSPGLPQAQNSSPESDIHEHSHSHDVLKGQGDLCTEKHVKAGTGGHWWWRNI